MGNSCLWERKVACAVSSTRHEAVPSAARSKSPEARRQARGSQAHARSVDPCVRIERSMRFKLEADGKTASSLHARHTRRRACTAYRRVLATEQTDDS